MDFSPGYQLSTTHDLVDLSSVQGLPVLYDFSAAFSLGPSFSPRADRLGTQAFENADRDILLRECGYGYGHSGFFTPVLSLETHLQNPRLFLLLPAPPINPSK